MKTIDVREKKYEQRFLRMKLERERFMPIWRDISDYIAPNRGLFDEREPNQGDMSERDLLDSTPTRALNLLQAGMQGGLTSPSRPWFQLTIDDPVLAVEPSVMRWLDDVKDIIFNVLSQSDIYNCLHGVYGEIGAFGIGAVLVDDDKENIVSGTLFTAGEYFVSFDARGEPDGFGRYLWMTVGQLVKEFGEDAVSERVRLAHREKKDGTWIKVCHLIVSDEDRETRCPWISLYWEDGRRESLSVKGYFEFPVMMPRWEPVGSDFYGYGPGWLALGESKTLQELRNDFLVAQKKSIDPPIVFPASAASDRMQVDPGTVNYASDPNNVARPLYQVQPDIPGQLQAMADSRNLIQQTFFGDLFLMIASLDGSTQMTAREVDVRQEEKMQMLGPVVERLEHELLNPLIGRVYIILLRRGMIPEPPEALRGRAVKIEYISMLALAQKASAIGAVDRLMALTAGLASMTPEVIDKLDSDKVLDEFVRLTAIPPVLIRTEEETAALRSARQQKQEQAQAIQQAQGITQAAQAGAGALKDFAQSQGGEVM